MSWNELVSKNCVTALPSSKGELDKLRSIVRRSLKDAAAADLSVDLQFVLAYDTARTLSLMIVRSEGYRPRSVGGHYNTFVALEAADPAFASLSAYFDGCRIKRNECEYDFAGGISETDAEGLLKTAQDFAVKCEAWIKARHPDLAA